MIDRLIPRVRFADRASLTSVVLIERGPDREEGLGHRHVVEALLRNSEDAYGFPPYPALAGFLSKWHGEDLHIAEREIISAALLGSRATRIQSPTYSWWQRLPALIDGRSRRVSTAASALLLVTLPD